MGGTLRKDEVVASKASDLAPKQTRAHRSVGQTRDRVPSTSTRTGTWVRGRTFGGLVMESAVHLYDWLNDLSGEVSPGTEDRADA